MEAEDQIINFATYFDPMLAHIVRTRLEDNGIPCFIADENMGTIYPVYNAAIGGIKLKIFARDLEKCKAIIAEDNTLAIENLPSDDASNAKAICPYCGSTNVRYGPDSVKNAGWFSKALAYVSLNPFLYNQEWHCFNCGKDFE